MKLPRSNDAKSQMISDLDRQRVLDLVAERRAEGYLDDSEREVAEMEVRAAVDRQGLNAVVGRVPKRRRSGSDKGDRRATDAERQDAIRKLEMYVAQGAVSSEEGARRIARVKMSVTPNDIDELFYDLGSLDANHAERLVSNHQRDEAVALLNAHLAEGRLTIDEHRHAVDQVRKARSQSEIDAAFRGLRSPRMTMTVERAKGARALATRAAGEGSRRAKRAVMRFAFAVAALLVAIPVGISGGGVVGAAACVMIAVGLCAAAIRSLVVG